MPNWCMNTVTLTSPDKKSATAFAKYLKEKDGKEWMSHFLPLPEEQKEDWYNWNVTNFGCKWDCDTGWDRKSQTFVLNFDSAWAPPIAMYEHLVEEGWSVEAKYWEPGMAFTGKFSDGLEEYCDYGNGDEIPEELDEYYGINEMLAEQEEYNEEGEEDE